MMSYTWSHASDLVVTAEQVMSPLMVLSQTCAAAASCLSLWMRWRTDALAMFRGKGWPGCCEVSSRAAKGGSKGDAARFTIGTRSRAVNWLPCHDGRRAEGDRHLRHLPIFKQDARNAGKFSSVVCHQRASRGARDGRDLHVIRPDRRSVGLQVMSNVRGKVGCDTNAKSEEQCSSPLGSPEPSGITSSRAASAARRAAAAFW
jgi:hypothetical protein